MKILGIDTATDVCGVALTEDTRLITEIRSNFKRAHAEKLIDAIDKVLRDAAITLKDLRALAISIGPGSFTGLRIGLSTVKGLAFANQLPIVTVNTLDALAFQAIYSNDQICPLIQAQADEVYTALYTVENFQLHRTSDYHLLLLDDLPNYINRKTLIVHSGVKKLSSALERIEPGLVTIAPDSLTLISGFSIARLAYAKICNEQFEDVATLEPYYLKEFKVKHKSEYS